MNKLSVYLPPFSPDYSGACSALFELGGMMVIHDAAGCTGNYTGYDEPRWYGSKSYVFCSAIREIDAVLGNDEKFIERIKDAARDLNPEFICFMGSPVPMVIGSDLDGIAHEIEANTAIPSFGFATTGLEYYDKGASAALLAFSRRILNGISLPKKAGCINLLGATPLDFANGSNLDDFKAEFEKRGLRVISSFAMGSGIDDIMKSSGASVNVVLSVSGLPLARYFKEVYKTPYVSGLPMGEAFCDSLCEMIRASEKDGENRRYVSRAPGKEDKRALIIAEQVTGNSIRAMLESEFDCNCAFVASMFTLDPELKEDGDLEIKSESELRRILKEGAFSVVIADPLIKELLADDSKAKFVPLPHVAISSKIHWDNPAELSGTKIKKYIQNEVFI